VLVAVIVALVAGSSAPWWWGKLIPTRTRDQTPSVASPETRPDKHLSDNKVPADKSNVGKHLDTSPLETGDSVEIVAISPSTDRVLPNDAPFAITARVHYRLVSADSWIFVPYLEQFAVGDKCGSPNHRTIGTASPNQVPIKRGEGEVSIQFTVAANQHSDLGDRGYIAPNASAWAGFDSQGRVIVIKEGLWSFADHCYQFGQ
jgi:hypothetical protein